MTKTVQEMIAVMQGYADGKPVEYRYRCREDWCKITSPSWNWDAFEYRIATIPDTIDWSHVSDEFICMARDVCGIACLFQNYPIRGMSVWLTPSGNVGKAYAFATYRRGTVDWKDSLVFRPGHEPKEDKA